MKNLVLFAMCSLLGVSAFGEAAVVRTLVRQQWPWTDAVRIDYEVAGIMSGAVDLDLQVSVNGAAVASDHVRDAVTGGALYGVRNGLGFVELDPKALVDATPMQTYNLTARLAVSAVSDPLIDRVEYVVFDLEAGTAETLRRADFYNFPKKYGAFTTDYASVGPGFASALDAGETFVWTGVNSNDVYKTTKLVMKRIPAAEQTFYEGPAEDDELAVRPGAGGNYFETRFQTTLTKDFYIGVFEVSQRQHELLTGWNPSYFTNGNFSATRPLEGADQRIVMNAATGLCQRANAKFPGYSFTLPTEAQWEFAAKAGYDGPGYPNGKAVSLANFAELEGYSVNYGYSSQNENVGNGGTRPLGTGRPNAYGLFNTLGNMRERTCDQVQGNLLNYFTNKGLAQPFVDPYVTQNSVGTECYSVKGGDWHWTSEIKRSRPSFRYGYVPAQTQDYGCSGLFGYRLVCECE